MSMFYMILSVPSDFLGVALKNFPSFCGFQGFIYYNVLIYIFPYVFQSQMLLGLVSFESFHYYVIIINFALIFFYMNFTCSRTSRKFMKRMLRLQHS
jgi:hypothetical protein